MIFLGFKLKEGEAMGEKKKTGRPAIEINQKAFEGLCRLQCTEEEICGFLEVDTNTLEKWCKNTYNMPFSEVFRQKSSGGKVSLRRNQWRLSEANAAMAIFLGKQHLGQTDTPKSTEEDPMYKEIMRFWQ
jgi:uncharacterized protein YjbI with pentapeptide repeats